MVDIYIYEASKQLGKSTKVTSCISSVPVVGLQSLRYVGVQGYPQF